MSLDDVCRLADIFKSAACASCDDSLLYVKFSIADLILKGVLYRTVKADKSFLLHIVKNIL